MTPAKPAQPTPTRQVAGWFDHPRVARVAAGKAQAALRLADRQILVVCGDSRALTPVTGDDRHPFRRAWALALLVAVASGALATFFDVLPQTTVTLDTRALALLVLVLLALGLLRRPATAGSAPGAGRAPQIDRGAAPTGSNCMVLIQARDAPECAAAQRALQRLGADPVRVLPAQARQGMQMPEWSPVDPAVATELAAVTDAPRPPGTAGCRTTGGPAAQEVRG